MKTHELKTINPYFQDSYNEDKTFEVRLNDRDFKVNDKIILKEYDPKNNSFSGRKIYAVITYILEKYEAIKENYIVFSYKIIKKMSKETLKEKFFQDYTDNHDSDPNGITLLSQ